MCLRHGLNSGLSFSSKQAIYIVNAEVKKEPVRTVFVWVRR